MLGPEKPLLLGSIAFARSEVAEKLERRWKRWLPSHFLLWMIIGTSAFRLVYSSATERRKDRGRFKLIVLFTGHTVVNLRNLGLSSNFNIHIRRSRYGGGASSNFRHFRRHGEAKFQRLDVLEQQKARNTSKAVTLAQQFDFKFFNYAL